MSNPSLEDFPPAVQLRLRAAMDRRDDSILQRSRNAPGVKIKRYTKQASKGPNRTEMEYNALFLGGKGIYEGVTLRLPGGSRYTPDWLAVDQNGRISLHEVKGAYRFHSEGRALTAWREAQAAFPMFRFIWAVKSNGVSVGFSIGSGHRDWCFKHGDAYVQPEIT